MICQTYRAAYEKTVTFKWQSTWSSFGTIVVYLTQNENSWTHYQGNKLHLLPLEAALHPQWAPWKWSCHLRRLFNLPQRTEDVWNCEPDNSWIYAFICMYVKMERCLCGINRSQKTTVQLDQVNSCSQSFLSCLWKSGMRISDYIFNLK